MVNESNHQKNPSHSEDTSSGSYDSSGSQSAGSGDRARATAGAPSPVAIEGAAASGAAEERSASEYGQALTKGKDKTPDLKASGHAGLKKLKSTVKIPSSLQTARQMAAASTAKKAETMESAPSQALEESALKLDLPYSQEQLLAAWEQYAGELKASGRQGEFVIMKEAPMLPGGHLVQVRVSNSVQQEFFEKARGTAQQFLRKTLQNQQISVESVMVKEEEGKRLYTAQEKFSYLLKKYPQLQELKERMGLEADF